MEPAAHAALRIAYRKALAVFLAFPPGVILLNAVAQLTIDDGAAPDPGMSTVLVAVGLLAATASFIAPRLLANQRMDELPSGDAACEVVEQVMMWELFIRLALSEVPGILAFVLTTMTGAGVESTALVLVSLASIAAAFPPWSRWESAFGRVRPSGDRDPGGPVA